MENNEFNEKELYNVYGGAPNEVVMKKVKENEKLYRKDKIAELENLKQEILKDDRELTEEELERILLVEEYRR